MVWPTLMALQAKETASASCDDDSLFGWVEGFDPVQSEVVEGVGEVHDVAAFEWSEAGVEVVEVWVDEVKGHDGTVPCFAEGAVAGGCGAGTVARPEAAAIGREEGVAFAFKWSGAGDIDDGVTGVLEPAAEVRLFCLTLGVEEAADGYDAVVLEAGVGGEDHVR